ncbi:MAG TPA: hypothetical protein PL121_02525 [bacterium]|nr:hypothetical protein [bacterium]HQK41854.1 hypothetical protein [bacterium]
MNSIKVKGSFSVEELKKRMLICKDIAERNRWQALYLAKTGNYDAKEIVEIIGFCFILSISWYIIIMTKVPKG